MAISDTERREVAARLRALDVHEWYDSADEVDSLETAIGCSIGQEAVAMARNAYGGYCRECGKWTPPGFGHFERYRGGWRVHCVECASGRKLPPEGDLAAREMQRHVENMRRDGVYGKRGHR